MGDFILKITAIVTGLMGLAGGTLKVFQAYRASESDLRKAWKSRSFRIGVFVASVGLVVLTGASWWFLSRKPFALTLQIWDIAEEKRHAVLASQRFPGAGAHGPTDEVLNQVGTWVVGEIAQEFPRGPEHVQVRVHVPADLAHERPVVEANPSVGLTTYFRVWQNGVKSRVAVDIATQDLASVGQDFELEVGRPGYTSQTVSIPWHNPVDKMITLTAQPVRVGIEEFTCQGRSVSTWLSNYLIPKDRLTIVGPENLNTLRAEIDRQKAAIARNPAIQTNMRASLDVDRIVSGTCE